MFFDRLNTTLELTIKGTATTIAAGNLKNFNLELTPWGYFGSAEWSIVCVADASEDKLFTPFTANDLISVKLTVGATYKEITTESLETPTPLVLQGLVVEKTVIELAFAAVTGKPILQRRYTIRFGDRGAVLWSQHRPCALYVNKTLKDLVEANKPDGVNIDHAWSASSTTYPVLSLGLGSANLDATSLGLGSGSNDPTYYDFLCWLFDGLNVGLSYDPATDKYKIADDKPTSTAVELRSAEVATLTCVFPPLHRNSVTVLNAYSEAATATKDIPNTIGVTGVRVDYLIRSAIASDLDARTTLETSRAKQHVPEARADLKLFPATPYVPGMIVKLASEWPTTVFQNGKQYRIVTARITAQAEHLEPTANDLDTTNRYQLDYVLQLELDSDPVVQLAPFRRPVWPFYVEGKVLSEVGAADELTFQPYQDSQTSLDYYKVKIPLWDNITGDRALRAQQAPAEALLLSPHQGRAGARGALLRQGPDPLLPRLAPRRASPAGHAGEPPAPGEEGQERDLDQPRVHRPEARDDHQADARYRRADDHDLGGDDQVRYAGSLSPSRGRSRWGPREGPPNPPRSARRSPTRRDGGDPRTTGSSRLRAPGLARPIPGRGPGARSLLTAGGAACPDRTGSPASRRTLAPAAAAGS